MTNINDISLDDLKKVLNLFIDKKSTTARDMVEMIMNRYNLSKFDTKRIITTAVDCGFIKDKGVDSYLNPQFYITIGGQVFLREILKMSKDETSEENPGIPFLSGPKLVHILPEDTRPQLLSVPFKTGDEVFISNINRWVEWVGFEPSDYDMFRCYYDNGEVIHHITSVFGWRRKKRVDNKPVEGLLEDD